MIKPGALLACAVLVALDGCGTADTIPVASAAQSHGRQCFRANEVYGYTLGPDGSVDVQTAQGPFRLRLAPGCPDFSSFMQIGLRPMESSWLCEGRSDRLITANPVPTNLCTVTRIESLGRGALSQG